MEVLEVLEIFKFETYTIIYEFINTLNAIRVTDDRHRKFNTFQ